MSLANSVRISFRWPNVDVFTFGKSSLYGYDSIKHCLLVHSSIQLNNTSEISYDQLHLSSSPAWPIRRLLLNEDETILALLADNIAYLVDLRSSSTSNTHHKSHSKGSRLCPIIRIPSSVNCLLIDFVWLTSNHFFIVYSIPSPSDCHLYSIRSIKQDGLIHLRTFSVGSSARSQCETPNKKISLHQSSEILKLDMTKRQDKDSSLLVVFAMKSDGDIFLLELEENLLVNDKQIDENFQGPLFILPSTFDNYGADHGQSTLMSLSNSSPPLLVFTRDRLQLHQCLLLSPSENQYKLFTMDSISFSTQSTGQIITSMIPDRFSSKKYFLTDSNGNVYLIEISWIDQIQQGVKQLQSTHIQQLIDGANSNSRTDNQIEQMGSIEIDQHGQYLAVIVKSQTKQEKELILVRTPSSTSDNTGFAHRIRSLLTREQSIPYVTLSSSTNISNSDFEKNLSQFIQLISEHYIDKQVKIHQELETKQRYLLDVQQTQSNEYKQLIDRFQQIQRQHQSLTEQYQAECSRRQRLVSHVGDLLSVIEQNTPVISNEETRMQQQLETYRTQIDVLKEQMHLIKEFISSNGNQKRSENVTMRSTQQFVQHSRNQIEQMKQRLDKYSNS